MPLQTLYNHVGVQSDVLQEVPGLGGYSESAFNFIWLNSLLPHSKSDN